MRGDKPFHVRLKQSLKKIGEALLNFFGGDFPVFILFLVIAFFFWWSRAMGDNYEMYLQVPVNVSGYPDEVRVTSPPATSLKVSLGGKGTALWKSKTVYRRHVLEIDSRRFQMRHGHASFATQALYDDIQALLPQTVAIRSIEPDSLAYEYILQTRVSVPVRCSGSFESRNQFFSESVSFNPDSVLISCPATLDTIPDAVYADVSGLVISSDSAEFDVKLIPVPDIEFDAELVHMSVTSSQYTEKRVEVPVVGVGFPDSLTLKTFPAKAAVSFWVRMSQFEDVSADDFKVVADYADMAGQKADRLEVHMLSQPQNVKNVSLQTRMVEILMERNPLW